MCVRWRAPKSASPKKQLRCIMAWPPSSEQCCEMFPKQKGLLLRDVHRVDVMWCAWPLGCWFALRNDVAPRQEKLSTTSRRLCSRKPSANLTSHHSLQTRHNRNKKHLSRHHADGLASRPQCCGNKYLRLNQHFGIAPPRSSPNF